MKFLYFLKTAKKTKFSWRFLELNEPFFSEVKEGLISTKGEKDIYRIFVNISKCQSKSFISSFTFNQ